MKQHFQPTMKVRSFAELSEAYNRAVNQESKMPEHIRRRMAREQYLKAKRQKSKW